MKTENNLQNKAAFFAQYLGQKVHWRPEYVNEVAVLDSIRLDVKYHYIGEEYCLLLSDLSNVCEADMTKAANVIGFKSDEHFIKHFGYDQKTHVKNYLLRIVTTGSTGYAKANKYLELIDYLRSRSYAIPWRDLSIQDLIEYGWIKIKDHENKAD